MRSHESVRAILFGLVLVPLAGVLSGCQAEPAPTPAPSTPTPVVAAPTPPKGVKVPTDKSLKVE